MREAMCQPKYESSFSWRMPSPMTARSTCFWDSNRYSFAKVLKCCVVGSAESVLFADAAVRSRKDPDKSMSGT